MVKNTFYFMLKDILILEIFKFCPAFIVLKKIGLIEMLRLFANL